jgi:hypothetical protein
VVSPTALTMKYLRECGYLVDIAERWIPGAEIRRDLFHVIDLVAIMPDEPILAVQATSLSNVSARVNKAQASQELAVWLKTGHARFQVFGWTLRGAQWLPKIVELRADEIEPVVVARPPRKRHRSKFTQGNLFADLESQIIE